MKRMIRSVAVMAALVLVLAACGSDGGSGELGLVTADTLTVCTDAPYRPMEFEEDGRFTGFDIELMRAIASEMGLSDTEVVNIGWDPIVSGLAMEAGDCDIAAASITILEERKENMNFTDGYFTADQSLLVRDDSGLNGLTEFGESQLGVQSDTTGHVYATDNAPEGTEIIDFADPGDLMTALQAGNVQGVLQDIVPNADYALSNDGFSLAETYTTDEEYGFAAKKDGSQALVDAINEALQALRDSGEYDDIWNDWFG